MGKRKLTLVQYIQYIRFIINSLISKFNISSKRKYNFFLHLMSDFKGIFFLLTQPACLCLSLWKQNEFLKSARYSVGVNQPTFNLTRGSDLQHNDNVCLIFPSFLYWTFFTGGKRTRTQIGLKGDKKKHLLTSQDFGLQIHKMKKILLHIYLIEFKIYVFFRGKMGGGKRKTMPFFPADCVGFFLSKEQDCTSGLF